MSNDIDKEEGPYSAELLDKALSLGAVLTGTPDGGEPITVVFSVEAWRKFDLATRHPVAPARRIDDDGHFSALLGNMHPASKQAVIAFVEGGAGHPVAPELRHVLQEITDAAETFMGGGVVGLRAAIDKSRALLAPLPSKVSPVEPTKTDEPDERRHYHQACDGRGCKGCDYTGSAPVEPVSEDKAMLDWIEQSAIRGGTYKDITSANIIVWLTEWREFGLRGAIAKAMLRNPAILAQQANPTGEQS